MESSKKLYLIVTGIVILCFALFEYNYLPVDLIPASAEASYFINLLSIASAVGGCFALLYFPRFQWVQQVLQNDPTKGAERLHKIRLTAWCLLMVLNVVFYYEARFATDSKYGILILVVALTFCWPSESSFSGKSGK